MTENEIKEKEVQEQLYKAIDESKSFRFEAGAGSGKTFALIECIKHVLANNINKLINNNQQVACITYTNVAVNEIQSRLGNSSVVIVSTIHERLWDLIKTNQRQLVKCHKEKLITEIDKINTDLSNKDNNKFAVFAALSESDKELYINFSFETKDLFYRCLNKKVGQVREAYNGLSEDKKPGFLSAALKNIANFQATVKHIYRRKKYQECVEKIKDKQETRIVYDSQSNNDRLDYMKFSHDTLLEYSFRLVEEYPTLRRIIIDKFPYIFIDEYQDTSEQVVNIIKLLDDYAKEHNKQWMVGYFGDTIQNIYDDGIGASIGSIHNVHLIDKIYNRRSHIQVIDVINRIRNDDLKQDPIDTNKRNGSVIFYKITNISTAEDEEDKDNISRQFLENYLEDMSGQKNEKIHCLVLTNKLLAKLAGFKDIYNVFSKADSIYYNELNTLLLSNEHEKLHPSILMLYRFVVFYRKLQKENTTYQNIFGSKGQNISFNEANNIIKMMKAINAESLGDLISEISKLLSTFPKDTALIRCINYSLNLDKANLHDFNNIENYVMSALQDLMVKNSESTYEDNSDEELGNIEKLLKIPLSQWELWVDFIDKYEEDKNIIFHTYHGTKGEEYDNVAIIMEDDFGLRNRNKFKKFFLYLKLVESEQRKELEDIDYRKQIENTRNLVYVACSRAVKNLRVLYLDDISDIEDGINFIFDEIIELKL